MEHKATRRIPARTQEVVEKVTCDLCRKDLNDEAPSSFDVAEVTVQMEEGSAYPEGRNTTTTLVDMCCACFKSKLLPWLQAQGVQPRERESW